MILHMEKTIRPFVKEYVFYLFGISVKICFITVQIEKKTLLIGGNHYILTIQDLVSNLSTDVLSLWTSMRTSATIMNPSKPRYPGRASISYFASRSHDRHPLHMQV